MAERITSIHLRGSTHSGMAESGRKSAEEMIRELRDFARRQKQAAEEVLTASDEDFRVETYVGVFRQRNKEIIQSGR